MAGLIGRLSGAGTRDTADELTRDISNLQLRLGSVGVNPTPPAEEPSFASKAFRVLNMPGSAIRSLLLEGVDGESGINWGRVGERMWSRQDEAQGINLLDSLGLAPQRGEDWSPRNFARFGLGLAADLATDPLSFVTGGITRPMQLLRAPVFGAPVATLRAQGVAQPFLRGSVAGLRGTGALGAALGDAGVLEAREAAKASTGLRPAELIDSLANRAPRDLTRGEEAGLAFGGALKDNPLSKGLFEAFSPDLLRDPAYSQMFKSFMRNVGTEQRGAMQELHKVTKDLPVEQQRLVTDLLEDPSLREGFGLRKALPTISKPHPLMSNRALEETLVQELPDNVRQAYDHVRGVLEFYGNERVKRGLLGSMLQNYFPHKLRPEPSLSGGLGSMAGLKQQSAKYREIREPIKAIETARKANPNFPAFEHEFVRPFAKEVLESARSIRTFDLFEEVNNQFGIRAEDIASRFGMTASMGDKLPEVIGGYKLVDFADFLVRGKKSQAFHKLGRVYLPAEISDDIQRLHNAYNSDDGVKAFAKVWDGLTDWWKPLVTRVNIPFHVNNLVGNIWNSFLGGMDNPYRLYDGVNVLLAKEGGFLGGNLTYKTLNELATKHGVIDPGALQGEFGQNLFRLAKDGLAKPENQRNFLRKFWDGANRVGQRVGEGVEGMSRAALFTDNMLKRVAKHGGDMTPELLDKFAREAAQHTNLFLFDYATGLSRFESEVMRRIAPFYSWSKWNIPRQVAELVNQPGKFLLYDKVQDNLASLNPLPQDAPQWLREGLNTGITLPGGGPLVVNPRLPLQDLNRIPGFSNDGGRGLLGMLNPALKLPIELITNRNLYTDRPIERTEGETVPTPSYLRPFTAVSDALGLNSASEAAGLNQDLTPARGDRVDPRLVHVADQLLGVGGRVGRIPDQFLQGEEFGDTDRLRLARMAVPGLYSYNAEKAREQRLFDERARLQGWLKKVKAEVGPVPTVTELRS